jgi:hypothetical protein
MVRAAISLYLSVLLISARSRKINYAVQLVPSIRFPNYTCTAINRGLLSPSYVQPACIIGPGDPAVSSLGESRMTHKQNKQAEPNNEAKRVQHSVAQRSSSARSLQAVFSASARRIARVIVDSFLMIHFLLLCSVSRQRLVPTLRTDLVIRAIIIVASGTTALVTSGQDLIRP